jgi:hypothetical protein
MFVPRRITAGNFELAGRTVAASDVGIPVADDRLSLLSALLTDQGNAPAGH